MLRRAVPAFAFALLLAGCRGGGSTGYTGHPCPALAIGVPGALVSPADGATGVSPAVGTLSFTIVNSTPSFAGATVSLVFDPNQRPTFSSPAVFAGGVYTVGLPPLQQHTKYTATAGFTSSDGYCSFGTSSLLGTFSTQ